MAKQALVPGLARCDSLSPAGRPAHEPTSVRLPSIPTLPPHERKYLPGRTIKKMPNTYGIYIELLFTAVPAPTSGCSQEIMQDP
jgi:hypothetical protein